jgi:hypothetical protein
MKEEGKPERKSTTAHKRRQSPVNSVFSAGRQHHLFFLLLRLLLKTSVSTLQK